MQELLRIPSLNTLHPIEGLEHLHPMEHKRWTVAEIKALNEANGGRFFSRENMRFAGDTMRSFTVCNETDDKGQLTGRVFLKRRIANKRGIPLTMWSFCTVTGRLRTVN